MAQSHALNDQQLASFARDGVLVVPNFYDVAREIQPIQEAIYHLIGKLIEKYALPISRPAFVPEHFDAGFQALIAANRRYGAEIYDAVKQIPAFVRLLSTEKHEQVFRALRPHACPAIAAGGYGIRIDHPGEERFRANWHQEYPAQLRSLDGVVFWSPLVTITEAIGPVQFCLGSHLAGPIPVYTRDPKNPEKSGAYSLTLKGEEELLRRYPHASPLTVPGDVVLVDFLTLHASGYNQSQRSRWSMQFRYFNFNEPTGVAHGWKGSYAAGVDFREIHPELCAD